ncbi:hypothetical protein ACFE33_05225 [Falsihalocynthiibacter sp. SS001]|uniref:hypothetical protein n=1 Tax=Falsihalocynthiibacter sp. SS001 TaxID=3349698 RepID=UPI0036D4077D
MRLIAGTLGLLMVAACGPTQTRAPATEAECQAALASRSGLSFDSAVARDSYFNRLIDGVETDSNGLRFPYLECLNRAGALPAGVEFESSAGYVPTSQRGRYGSNVLSDGASYRTESFKPTPAPAPTVVSATPKSAPAGKLALPTQYPLQAGDAELWTTLTLEQQKRALSFLETGSTIRSSLEGDI